MHKDKIRPFHFWTQHVLPLVYDDSLSYLEVLYKVKIKLNEVISWANNFTDELYKYIDEKTQENLQQMQQEMAAYKEQVDGELETLQTNIDYVNQRMDGIITEVNTIINNFQNKINQSFDEFKSEITSQLKEQDDKVTAQLLAQNIYVQNQIALIKSQMESNKQWNKKYTDDEIKKVIAMIPDLTELEVTSPVTGIIGDVQTSLNDLFKLFLSLGEPITAEEYDSLNLTADNYDNRNLTAYQYDYYGKRYLIGDTPTPIPSENYHVYSLNEKVVGQWIDGRNVYEKTYIFDAVRSTNWIVVDSTLTNSIVDVLIGFEGSYVVTSAGSVQEVGVIPYSSGAPINNQIYRFMMTCGENGLQYTFSIVPSATINITIKYVKKNDETNIIFSNDYESNEIIVGSYLGSNLYRKVYSGTFEIEKDTSAYLTFDNNFEFTVVNFGGWWTNKADASPNQYPIFFNQNTDIQISSFVQNYNKNLLMCIKSSFAISAEAHIYVDYIKS